MTVKLNEKLFKNSFPGTEHDNLHRPPFTTFEASFHDQAVINEQMKTGEGFSKDQGHSNSCFSEQTYLPVSL